MFQLKRVIFFGLNERENQIAKGSFINKEVSVLEFHDLDFLEKKEEIDSFTPDAAFFEISSPQKTIQQGIDFIMEWSKIFPKIPLIIYSSCFPHALPYPEHLERLKEDCLDAGAVAVFSVSSHFPSSEEISEVIKQ